MVQMFGMVQSAGGLRFALKAGERLGILGDVVREEFQGDKTVQPGIFGFVYNAHAAAAQALDNSVMGQGSPQKGLRIRHCAPILGCAFC